MSSWALLPLRGFSITYILRTHKCAPASQQFFSIDYFEDTCCHKHMVWLSGCFLVFKLTGIIFLAWDDAIQGMHSLIQYLLAWEWSRENIQTFDLLTTTIILRCQDPLYWVVLGFFEIHGNGSKLIIHSLSFWKLSIKNIYIYIYAILPLGSFLEKQGVCHTMALPFRLKSILRQKKNYGNSNISPCKNIIFKKSSKCIPKSFKRK
jgi:hypothetical protein